MINFNYESIMSAKRHTREFRFQQILKVIDDNLKESIPLSAWRHLINLRLNNGFTNPKIARFFSVLKAKGHYKIRNKNKMFISYYYFDREV